MVGRLNFVYPSTAIRPTQVAVPRQRHEDVGTGGRRPGANPGHGALSGEAGAGRAQPPLARQPFRGLCCRLANEAAPRDDALEGGSKVADELRVEIEQSPHAGRSSCAATSTSARHRSSRRCSTTSSRRARCSVVLELGHVEFLDSSGLRVILAAANDPTTATGVSYWAARRPPCSRSRDHRRDRSAAQLRRGRMNVGTFANPGAVRAPDPRAGCRRRGRRCAPVGPVTSGEAREPRPREGALADGRTAVFTSCGSCP